tara:strand:- start:1533 stop:1889 length:357 start_codon:yes stop_codon:yes gene_type:complete
MASPNTRIEQLEKQMALLMKDKAIEPPPEKPKPQSKAKSKAKSEDDPEKPKKKRTSGYIIFSNANREEVKERLLENAQEGEKPRNTEVMKELARMWKELDDDEKGIWNAKAKSDSEED